jgi:hypothetical protein
LDGPRKFQGSAVDDQIQFERNGVKESIRATNGAGTGMKWLSDKSNCLTVRAGDYIAKPVNTDQMLSLMRVLDQP